MADGRAGALFTETAGNTGIPEMGGLHRPHGNPQCGFPGRCEPVCCRSNRLPDPDGAGCTDPGRNPEKRLRLLSRFHLVAGADASASGAGGAVRIRLPDSAESGSEGAGRSVWRGGGLYRSARLVRSLSTRCGLGRSGSDVRPVCRRRAYPAGLQPGSVLGGANYRHG